MVMRFRVVSCRQRDYQKETNRVRYEPLRNHSNELEPDYGTARGIDANVFLRRPNKRLDQPKPIVGLPSSELEDCWLAVCSDKIIGTRLSTQTRDLSADMIVRYTSVTTGHTANMLCFFINDT